MAAGFSWVDELWEALAGLPPGPPASDTFVSEKVPVGFHGIKALRYRRSAD